MYLAPTVNTYHAGYYLTPGLQTFTLNLTYPNTRIKNMLLSKTFLGLLPIEGIMSFIIILIQYHTNVLKTAQNFCG